MALVEVDGALYREAKSGSLGHIKYFHRIRRKYEWAHTNRTELTGANGGAIETKHPLTDEEIMSKLASLIDRNESTVATDVET